MRRFHILNILIGLAVTAFGVTVALPDNTASARTNCNRSGSICGDAYFTSQYAEPYWFYYGNSRSRSQIGNVHYIYARGETWNNCDYYHQIQIALKEANNTDTAFAPNIVAGSTQCASQTFAELFTSHGMRRFQGSSLESVLSDARINIR